MQASVNEPIAGNGSTGSSGSRPHDCLQQRHRQVRSQVQWLMWVGTTDQVIAVTCALVLGGYLALRSCMGSIVAVSSSNASRSRALLLPRQSSLDSADRSHTRDVQRAGTRHPGQGTIL
jgi:hypothetical protein